MPGEELGRTFTDERNADSIDQAFEAVLFAGGDFVDEILGGFFGHAIEIGERFEIEPVNIGVVFHEIFFDELIDNFFAEAINVHGVAACEVNERFPSARWAGNIDAAIGYFTFGAMDARAADRALVRHLELLFFGAVLDDLQHMRDYFTGALDKNCVASVDVEAFDFVHIVESGLRNSDAADLHWLKDREGSEHAGAAHADGDFAKESRFLMCGILVRDGPTGRLRSKTEFVLQADLVHFDYDAVDFIFQFFALRFPGREIFLHFRERMADFPIVTCFETEIRER